MKPLSRRGFLAAGGAVAAAPVVGPVLAETAPAASADGVALTSMVHPGTFPATYSWHTYGGRMSGGFTQAELENLAADLLKDMFPFKRVTVERAYDENGLLLPPDVAARLPKDRTPG